jgi:hypothetical protein
MIRETCRLCPGLRPLGGVCPDCGYDPNCPCCILAVSKKETEAFFAVPVYDSLTW